MDKKSSVSCVECIIPRMVPEAVDEESDFLEFLKDKSLTEYLGRWRLYFVEEILVLILWGSKILHRKSNI